MEDIVEISSPMVDSAELVVPIHDISYDRAAVFGRIVFGQSTYGFGISSGSFLIPSKMIDMVDMSCKMDDQMVILSLMED